MTTADPAVTPGMAVTRTAHADGDVLYFAYTGRGRLNLAGGASLRQATDTVAALAGDRDVRCAVLSGPSPAAWIGGADLEELGALTEATAERFIRAIHDFCAALRVFPVPVIARIQGYCLGAGLEIAAACDLRVCDDTARFGMPEVRVGVPSVIEAALLPMLIGWGRTRELLYRGHVIDAREAARIGLVEHLADTAALPATVAAIVDDIRAGAPQAMRAQKALVARWEQLTLENAIDAGVAAFVTSYRGTEPADYTARFFAHRKSRKEKS